MKPLDFMGRPSNYLDSEVSSLGGIEDSPSGESVSDEGKADESAGKASSSTFSEEAADEVFFLRKRLLTAKPTKKSVTATAANNAIKYTF